MGSGSRARRHCRLAVAAAIGILVAGCGGHAEVAKPTEPRPSSPRPIAGHCRELTIAYDATNGYEASAFIVGSLAEHELGCRVTYRQASSRNAWRLVSRGKADVYLDAYGNEDLRTRLAGPKGTVTVVGPNGVRGGVDLLAPYFMGERGLETFRDLDDVDRIGWGTVTPAITTVPALLALARAFVESQGLDYAVRDYTNVGSGAGMADLLQQPRADDEHGTPSLYLGEGPLAFIGDGPGRQAVQVPNSAAESCVPDAATTLCSLDNFRYLKIANSDFASSGSPAYNLVFNYHLSREDAANVLEIVELSGYHVGAADVASWINTHRDVWRRWLD